MLAGITAAIPKLPPMVDRLGQVWAADHRRTSCDFDFTTTDFETGYMVNVAGQPRHFPHRRLASSS
jgi:hypothetical protein